MAETEGGGEGSRRRHARWLVPFLCSLLGLALLLPKPLHIDDPFYLAIADQITRDPARPYSFVFNWWGTPQPAYATALSPPLFSYWLALIVAAFGHSALALHLATWVFLVVASLATYSLARRFTASPGVATALVMLSPAVLPSCNVMLDIPALGLALAALAVHIHGEDSDRAGARAAAALLAAAAVLTKYQAGAVCLLMAAYSLLQRRPRALLWQAIPASAFLGWMVFSDQVYGVPQLFATHPLQTGGLGARAVAYVTAFGACAFLSPLALAARPRRRVGFACVGLLIVAGAAGRALQVSQARAETFVFLANGALWLLAAVWPAATRADARTERQDARFLGGWALLFPAVGAVGAPFPALRHLLPSLPALVMLALRCASPRAATWQGRASLALCLAVTAGVGVGVALGDLQFARAYPLAARRVAPLGPRGHVWYLGHWGWQYYADRAGLKQLSAAEDFLPPGDIVVAPQEPDVQPASPRLAARLERVSAFTVSGLLPVRTMSKAASAGFYASPPPLVPYAFSRVPLERFMVYRVRQYPVPSPARRGALSPGT